MNRRDFGGALSAAALVLAAGQAAQADEPARPKVAAWPPIHDKPLPVVGMLLYPGLTLQDLLGPQTVLSTAAKIHLVWKTKDFVESDSGIVLRPDTTFDECPADLDVLFVGGGAGQAAVMTDPEVTRFLADRGARAKFVTSVCTGSLVLGAAGLLRGYEATCHWAGRDLLKMFGATPSSRRVVVDRNRVSGGGVTAGMDFGLTLLQKMLGQEPAMMTQLAIEYDPAPPFDCGTPEKAGPDLTHKVLTWMGPFGKELAETCQQAAKSMPQ